MAKRPIIDGRIWLDSWDISGDANRIEVAASRPAQECTNFDSAGWGEHAAGVAVGDFTAAGFYDAEASDACVDALHGTTAIQTYGEAAALGSVSYFGVGPVLSASRGLPVGAFATIETSGRVSPLHRGVILLPKTTATATANGASLEHGAVSADQTLYACLHVFEASAGDTLDVVVASDDDTGFASSTSRIAFTQATATGSEIKSLAGAITDDWWRVEYTIAGDGSESFSFAVSIAIV